ncbi:MAG: hypothetical protein NTX22_17850 [Ignavibacteriales bacterium]|nr:hypothetical protein [Ignavibacteriales bacterium]
MKSISSLLLVLFISGFLMAQKTSVPQKIKDSFNKLYPQVTEVKWSKEGKNEFEAGFKVNGVKTSIVLDVKGKLIETETTIQTTELPKGVEEFIKKNHPDHKITETAKIVDSKSIATYEVEITKGKQKKDLIFDNSGKLVVKKEMKGKKDKEGKEEDEEKD